MSDRRSFQLAVGCVALLLALAATGAQADYSVQDNLAFNANKINPYTGGPERRYCH